MKKGACSTLHRNAKRPVQSDIHSCTKVWAGDACADWHHHHHHHSSTKRRKKEKNKKISSSSSSGSLSLSLSQGFWAAATISAQEGDAFIDTMSSTGSRERTLVVGQAIAGHLHHDDYQLVERLSQRLIVRADTKSNERRQHFSILLSVTDIQRVLLIVCLYVRVDNFVREWLDYTQQEDGQFWICRSTEWINSTHYRRRRYLD